MKRLLSSAAVTTAATVCLLAGGVPASVTQVGSMQVISRATGTGAIPHGNYTDSYTWQQQQSASDNGRYVAFISGADGFSTEDDNRYSNIFVRDRQTDTTILVSRADGVSGAGASANSDMPAISADGKKVVFRSSATNLVSGVSGPQLYIRDTVNHTTELVSRADGPSGAAANLGSAWPSISDNGSVVAFWSAATNLVTPAPSPASQIYVRDVNGDTTRLVSRENGTDAIGGNTSINPSISGDGTAVAFTSFAKLNTDDTNSVFDVYLRPIMSTTTTLISRGGGGVGNGSSGHPAVNTDGTKIAFTSTATNLDVDDATAGQDIYLRDTTGGTTTLISRATGVSGEVSNGKSEGPAISGDGKIVVFQSQAMNLVPPAGPTDYDGHVYVRDLTNAGSPTTAVADRASGASGAIGDLGAYAPWISKDGTKVVFTSYSTNLTAPPGDADFAFVLMRDLGSSTTSLVSRPSGTSPIDRQTAWSWQQSGSVSSDGRYVAFMSDSDSLTSDNDDRWWGVYRRDTLTNTTVYVSRASGASGAAANRWSEWATISADGTRIAFESEASNLVPNDTNGVQDCFVRDLTTNTTLLVSRTSAGAPLTKSSGYCAISDSGNRVVFVTAQLLDPADSGSGSDAYVRDLTTNQTLLASRHDGPAGLSANTVSPPSINADGTKVAFSSSAALTTDGATGNVEAFVRDLTAGTTKLVSRASGASGAVGDNSSWSPLLDAAGRHVAFSSYSTNFTSPPSTNPNVFVRDLTANTTMLVSRATGASGAIGDGGSYEPAISDDGTVVAFYSAATNLVAGDTNQKYDVFVRNLATNTTAAVSRGPDGALGDDLSFTPAVSGSGHCIAFRSYADNMDPAVGASDFGFVYMRTIAGECPNDPPDTTITAAPPANTRSRDATIRSASNDPAATFQCALDGAAFAACNASHDITGLADGSHTLQVRAVDPAGNPDPSPASATWTVDATAPILKITVLKQRLKGVLRRGLRLRLKSSEPATANARVARKGRVVGRARKSLGTAAKTLTIRLHLSKKARRALAKARRVRFVVTVVVKDPLGNTRTIRRTIVIRR